ncbi:MAG: hypothetical protein IKG67_08540 [Parasporobacterium sp.]|nr:hypothetical protein [Parasporobacterium sp.]
MDNNRLSNTGDTGNTQISLVVNRNKFGENTIDLGRVLHNLKVGRRLYAWILILCMVLGFCIPLLIYQINRIPLTVYSVVTLKYEIDNPNALEENAPARIMVEDLTAPDGTELDLNQITSSYVLQNALTSLELSQPINLSNLRSNIGIQRILTEDSQRQQEILNSMMENKNSGAYDQMAKMETNYTNTFIVSLANGFGDEDSSTKLELKEDELRLLLDQILVSYNDYLVRTYQDVKLPEDEVSVIDLEELDIPEGVDQLHTALRNLTTYCEEKPDIIKSYRSKETGYSLNDLISNLELIQEVDVEYLSSYVFSNGIAVDRDEVIDNYRYNLLTAQVELDRINDDISAVNILLDNYKNDEILVTSQDTDNMLTATTSTAYYNNLLLKQAENEKRAADKKAEITDIQTRITALINARNTVTEEETEEAKKELERLAGICSEINDQVRAHMEEVFSSSFYNTLAEHSTALGRSKSFLEASAKNIILGVIAGAVVGCVIWFFGAVLPEFSHQRKEEPEPAEETKEGEADAE